MNYEETLRNKVNELLTGFYVNFRLDHDRVGGEKRILDRFKATELEMEKIEMINKYIKGIK